MLQELFSEMNDYYRNESPGFTAAGQWTGSTIAKEIRDMMDDYAAAHPDESPYSLKVKLHETIAEHFEPKLFPHSPFFYEMGVRPAMNWGCPHPCHAGAWLWDRNHHLFQQDSHKWQALTNRNDEQIDLMYNPVDIDHYSLGYTKLLTQGIQGVMDEALDALPCCTDDEEREFVQASLRSMTAVLKIAAKFADKADELLKTETTEQARTFLTMISTSARRVPKEPPTSFYEGLAMMWFLREVCASLEGIGISVIGHPDRVLIDLYLNDLATERITKEDAIDLVSRWYAPTDIKWDLANNPWPETSTTMTLGGCDRDGIPIYNEVTQIMLEAHHRHNFMNPKLNCRYSRSSPPEYLNEISRQILNGHNVFAMLNDDTLIPANVKAGKRLEDCRLYCSGGCQETILEGTEHSAGAYYYFNLPKMLDFVLNDHPELDGLFTELGIHPPSSEQAQNFEQFYDTIMGYAEQMIVHGAVTRAELGRVWPQVNPSPLFSASIADCLQNHKDYTSGGARYNPGGISFVGLGTLVDSLYTLKKAIFEEQWVTMTELRQILTENWEGHEALRQRVINLPKYGHDCDEVDQLAARVAEDIYNICSGLTNERGGKFQPSFFVYYFFARLSTKTLATPDGRRNFEMYSQGIAPGRLRPADSLTSAIHTLEKIDFDKFPGNAVLDVQLPLGNMNEDILSAYMRVFSAAKGPTIQCNCIDVATLKEAQQFPEKHQDLMVRISGLSAKFVALTKDIQDEIITRNVMG